MFIQKNVAQRSIDLSFIKICQWISCVAESKLLENKKNHQLLEEMVWVKDQDSRLIL